MSGRLSLFSTGTPAMACGSFVSGTRIALPCRIPLGVSKQRRSRRVVGVAAASQRVSFQKSVSTDLLLREYRSVTFDQYMEDEDRIFSALFPDTRRRQKLNDEEWRIFMLPLEFFFLSVRPVIDMRITLKEPPRTIASIGKTVTKLLTLEATRWEMRGLDYVVNPSDFDLGINGFLYPERGGSSTRLKGEMKLTVNLAVPPSLGLMPPPVIESFGKALLSQLLENMKERVNSSLLQDYKDYALQQRTQLSSTREF